MTRFCSFASGSSGNAALLSCGDTHILIDAGISCRRICRCLQRLGLTPADLTGIVITHEHADHIAGLATWMKKYRTPILCTPGTALQLEYRLAGIERLLHPVEPWASFYISEDLTGLLLPTSHDCAQGCGLGVTGPDGVFCFYTDTGVVPDHKTQVYLATADMLVLESNYDEDMLLSGPYPYQLKRRILGERGHLSNDAAAALALACGETDASTILLAHLSRENNTPQRALETVGAPLEAMGWGGRLEALPRDVMSPIYTFERTICGELESSVSGN